MQRSLIVILALSFLCGSLPAAEAQQVADSVRRIGLLNAASLRAVPENIVALQQGLRALGYVEGQNLTIEYRYAEGQLERLPALAAELVRLRVEVIVTGGAPAIRAAQHATHTIPIVMAGTADPVAAGFVASLARPGGNITGVGDLSLGLPGKRLSLLKQTVPQLARIAVLTDSTYTAPSMQAYTWIDRMTVTARTLGVSLHLVELHRADELDRAFALMRDAGAEALLVMEGGALLLGLRAQTVNLAARHRLPAIYERKQTVLAGGLMSYGPNIAGNWRHAATYVDKLLKGAMPADLSVRQPTEFDLVINLKTAQALGLTIPPTILFQAVEVIR